MSHWQKKSPQPGIPGRRRFLKLGAMAAVGGLAPLSAAGSVWAPERSLSLYNLHTGESLDAVYWAGGRYLDPAQAAVNRILRDHRNDQTAPISPALLDLLFAITALLEKPQPFHIISGYRSPATNAQLAATSHGVARGSLHMEGKAVDIRLPGVELQHLRNAVASLQAGGVGYYPASGFVHVDIGRVRAW